MTGCSPTPQHHDHPATDHRHLPPHERGDRPHRGNPRERHRAARKFLPQTKTIDQRLREAIQKDGRKLAIIAKAADTAYMALWSWYTGRQAKYDFVQAEKVHRALTGKGFGE